MKNKHLNAMITKFLLYGPIMAFILPFFVSIGAADALFIALVLVPTTYVVIDLQLLPKYNAAALVSEILLSALAVLGGVYVLTDQLPSYGGLLVVASLVGIGEWYFHGYLIRAVFKRGGKKG